MCIFFRCFIIWDELYDYRIKTKRYQKAKTVFDEIPKLPRGGCGAALQEAMNASVKTYFPSAPAGIVEGVEWVASSLAAGAIDQDQIAAFFNGIGNGAMKDVFKILFSKFGLSKFVPSGMGLPSQTVSAPQTSSRDFII